MELSNDKVVFKVDVYGKFIKIYYIMKFLVTEKKTPNMNSKDDRQKVYKLFFQSEFTLDGSKILNKERTSNILGIQEALQGKVFIFLKNF